MMLKDVERLYLLVQCMRRFQIYINKYYSRD